MQPQLRPRRQKGKVMHNSKRNPSIEKMRNEVEFYKLTFRAYLLMAGEKLDEITPFRNGSLLQRFKFLVERFDSLWNLKSSSEQKLALKLILNRLRRMTAEIEEGHHTTSVGGRIRIIKL